MRLSQGGRLPGRAPENCGLAEASGTPEVGARQGSALCCRQVPAGPAPPRLRSLWGWPRLRGSPAWPQAGLAAPPWAPRLFPLANLCSFCCSGRPSGSSERFSKTSRSGTHSFCCPNVHAPCPPSVRLKAGFEQERFSLGCRLSYFLSGAWLETRFLLQLGVSKTFWLFFFCFFFLQQAKQLMVSFLLMRKEK